VRGGAKWLGIGRRARRAARILVFALALALAAGGAAASTVVVVPEGPRDQFDCENGAVARKRYRTTDECLQDLCGTVFSADRASLYVKHPRTEALVRNPCFMLDGAPSE
jgi:hypothetical protein